MRLPRSQQRLGESASSLATPLTPPYSQGSNASGFAAVATPLDRLESHRHLQNRGVGALGMTRCQGWSGAVLATGSPAPRSRASSTPVHSTCGGGYSLSPASKLDAGGTLGQGQGQGHAPSFMRVDSCLLPCLAICTGSQLPHVLQRHRRLS